MLFSFWFMTWPLPSTPQMVENCDNLLLLLILLQLEQKPERAHGWNKGIFIDISERSFWGFTSLSFYNDVFTFFHKTGFELRKELIGHSRIYSVRICTIVLDIFPMVEYTICLLFHWVFVDITIEFRVLYLKYFSMQEKIPKNRGLVIYNY